jgi:polar amino acid transport system substrate-binding protein
VIPAGRGGGRPAGSWARAGAAAGLVAILAAGCGATSAPQLAVPTPPAAAPVTEPVVLKSSPAARPEPDCPTTVPAMSPLPKPGQMPPGTTMARIKKRGFLIAGVDQDSYRWGYPNPSPTAGPGEAYLGFDIDILHALAYAIFGNPDKIGFLPVTQDFRMGAAYEGIVDVVADSITITCPRSQQVRFSIDYFDAGQRLLVQRGNQSVSVAPGPDHKLHISGLRGQKVCTVNTTTSVTNLTSVAKSDGFTVIGAGNWSDCLVLLQQHAVQAISTDNTILGGLEAEDPGLSLVGQPFSHEPHGLAFPKSDLYSATNAEFVSFANGVIRGLESRADGWCPEPRTASEMSCWAALYDKWVGPQLGLPAPTPPSPLYPPVGPSR